MAQASKKKQNQPVTQRNWLHSVEDMHFWRALSFQRQLYEKFIDMVLTNQMGYGPKFPCADSP